MAHEMLQYVVSSKCQESLLRLRCHPFTRRRSRALQLQPKVSLPSVPRRIPKSSEAIRDVDAVFTSIYQRLIIGVSFRAPTFACICPIVSLPAYRHYVLAATAAVAICIHIQIRFHCFQGMVTHCVQVLGIP